MSISDASSGLGNAKKEIVISPDKAYSPVLTKKETDGTPRRIPKPNFVHCKTCVCERCSERAEMENEDAERGRLQVRRMLLIFA